MKPTAIILAIYMLIGGLIPKTDFSQLVRLGDLKTHYLEHKDAAASNNEYLSFLEFYYIHYIDGSKHEDDNHEDEHQRLPFQTINTLVLDVVVFDRPEFNKSSDYILTSNFYASPFHLKGFSMPAIEPPSC